MDAGVIAMVKKSYRYRLLERLLDIYQERKQVREAAKTARMRAGTMGLDERLAPHLRDIMDILNDVWNEITPTKVKN